MFFRIRRSSDSVMYTIIWWLAFISCNIGLAVYAYFKIQDLKSREFFLQTTEKATPEVKSIMSFPDMILCSTGTRIADNSSLYDEMGDPINITDFELANSSVPMYHSLCGDHQWATIFHTNNEFVNVSQNTEGMYWFSLAPTDLNAPRECYSFLYFAPYSKNASQEFTQESSIDYLYNQFWFPQNNTHLNVQIVNIETLILREGFWGYFGLTEKVAKLSLSTEGSSFFGAGPSLVSVLFPRKEINQKQILFTTVQSAFGDWGGTFSVIWGIFYFLLGAPRLDPFGVVATLLMSKKVRRRIRKKYGSLPQQQPHLDEADAHLSRPGTLVTGTSVESSLSSLYSDPALLKEKASPVQSPSSVLFAGVEDVKAGKPQQQLTHRLIEERFKRLENMLGEFYLKIPEDDEDDDDKGHSMTLRQSLSSFRLKLESFRPSHDSRSTEALGRGMGGRYKQASDSQITMYD